MIDECKDLRTSILEQSTVPCDIKGIHKFRPIIIIGKISKEQNLRQILSTLEPRTNRIIRSLKHIRSPTLKMYR